MNTFDVEALKKFATWLSEEAERADKDVDISTTEEDRDYHIGEFDAYTSALSNLRAVYQNVEV